MKPPNSRSQLSLMTVLVSVACMISAFADSQQIGDEAFRPQFHFTPAGAWMNDPNGLVYDTGEYHLFYKHNPKATKWGPMHWGHAVSTDLIHWQHLPIALGPDKLGTIFSGSAVIDSSNTAGFGAGAMVAIFTHNQGDKQVQSLASSTDHGRTWTKYPGNPVLTPPGNIRNFRDPKVFWFEAGKGNPHWVMLLAAGNAILIYGSSDLKTWTPSGGFGFGHGATCGVWETPDLFELPIDGGSSKRWVLSVGIGDCAPAGGSGMQYFVGQFDGKTFVSDNPKDTILWTDFGADFYAAQSWNNPSDPRRIWLGWMNNWRYAEKIPTSTWRGAFSIPRELSLKKTKVGLRLSQQPIRELEKLRGKHWSFENIKLGNSNKTLEGVSGEKLEVIARFKLDKASSAQRIGVRVRVGGNEQTTIGYNIKAGKLFVDRSQSGQVDFSTGFRSAHIAPLELVNGELRLHLLIDRSSVEVFSENGLVSITESIFPKGSSLGLQVFAEAGNALVSHLDVYELKSAVPTKH
jgi:fructan beta-fructosidase